MLIIHNKAIRLYYMFSVIMNFQRFGNTDYAYANQGSLTSLSIGTSQDYVSITIIPEITYPI
jgi:hypothetical protein